MKDFPSKQVKEIIKKMGAMRRRTEEKKSSTLFICRAFFNRFEERKKQYFHVPITFSRNS